MMKSVLGNKYLIFSSTIILIWGVNFTLNTSIMFPVLAVNYAVMAFIICYPVYKGIYKVNLKHYWPFILYWSWLIYAAIRGFCDCDSNIRLMAVLDYLFASLLSLFVFLPNNIFNYRRWVKYFWKIGWLWAILLIPFNVSHSFYFHYLILVIPLWKYLSTTNKLLILFALIYSLRFLDPRAHVPKYCVDLILFMLPCSFLKNKIIKILHPILLLLPIALFVTGVLGIFNPFNMENYLSTDVKIQQGGETFDATIDTRTVIYEDVISSAFDNDYVITGRNLANGNDSRFNSFLQRNTNEASVLNHFTKMGIVGVLLLFILFVYSSSLAVYRSNNHWVKLIGIYVAFRWVMLWIEDPESFSSLYLSIWLLIGVCVSSNIRKMSDFEMSNFLRTFLKL